MIFTNLTLIIRLTLNISSPDSPDPNPLDPIESYLILVLEMISDIAHE